MIDEVFADGISEVNIAAGIVRINFVSYSATEKDAKGNPTRELRHRVVTTPQGVLELYASMKQVIDKLVETGVLQRRPDQSLGAPTGQA
jgi:hypothetical protein